MEANADSHSYPVTLEFRPPVVFDRIQVLLRLGVLAALGLLHQTAAGLFGAVYLLLPVGAAVLISRNGAPGFRKEDERWLMAALDWVVAFYAYLFFVTDRFPLGSRDRDVRLVVHAVGVPTAGGALGRLVTSVPSAIVLAVLCVASSLVCFAAGLLVLLTERVPESLQAFQRDVLAWMARLLAYHAALVEPYPPFSLTGQGEGPKHGGADHAPLA